MKAALGVVLLGIVLLGTTSCGGESKPDEGGLKTRPPTIEGKWRITEASGAMADTNRGNTYEFLGDGTLRMSLGGFTNTAKYEVRGNAVSWTVGGVTVNATFEIQGDTMKMEIQGSDQKFTMKKE